MQKAQTYRIRLPDGTIAEREMEQTEAEYWLSLGMYLGHGFHAITTQFQAEMMAQDDGDDMDEDYIEVEPDEEKGPTIN